MSANIQNKDTVISLVPCWHKLETIVDKIDYDSSGLNWSVEKRSLQMPDGKEIEGFKAIFSPEKDQVITVSKDSYSIIQNERLFELIDNSLAGINHKIITCGSLGNCQKVYICIELSDEQDYLVNTDKFKNYLAFVTSHDGSLSLECYDTSIRLCCQNTLVASRKSKGILDLSVRHTKNNAPKITNMEEQIDKLLEKRVEFYGSYEELCSRPMSIERANAILTGFVGKDDLSTRAKNKAAELTHLFVKGTGNKGENYSDLLNSVTEFYTHRAGSNAANSFASSEFGMGSQKKAEFWDIINDEAALSKLEQRGLALIAS